MSEDFMDGIEDEPVFIASQLRVGETLTERHVAAIQAVISENDRLENEAVEEFSRGRECGIKEIGGDELWNAFEGASKAFIDKSVRRVMDALADRRREHETAKTSRQLLIECLTEARQHLNGADIDLNYIDEVIARARAEGRE